MKAPFPWFGGKSRVADQVWLRFGDVPNYVEPFFGSGAVMFARPTMPNIETVNDRDCFIANFFRALQADPEGLARWADYPVNEADLHARHLWLVNQASFRQRMMSEPDYFDVKIAGWWVWGISCWIGSGWCSRPEWSGRINAARAERGVHRRSLEGDGETNWLKRPQLNPSGVHRVNVPERDLPKKRVSLGRGGRGVVGETCGAPSKKLPSLNRGGKGVVGKKVGIDAEELDSRRPHITTGGMGIHALMIEATSQQIPDIGGCRGAAGRGVHASGKRRSVGDWFQELSARLRRVRVCCGDWSRVVGRSPTECIGLTGIFLDPPYTDLADRRKNIYAHDSFSVGRNVRTWAIEKGDNPMYRIALCGYEGEYQMPTGWTCIAWKANGGHGNAGKSGKGRANALRERIWFSPHCLEPEAELFKP